MPTGVYERTEQHLEIIRANQKKAAKSPNRIKKVITNNKTRLYTKKEREGKRERFLGIPLSEEHRKKLSDSRKGVKHSELRRFTKGEKQKLNEKGTNSSKITRYEAWIIKFILIPNGYKKADIARAYKLSRTSISDLANGKTWKFVKLYDYPEGRV